MKLKELLNTLPKETKIKVGAHSMFVYCGDNDQVATSFLSEFKSKNLLEREVIETYDSIPCIEPNTKIIKIVGEEDGRYCLMSEFVKPLNKYKKQLEKQNQLA